MQQRSFPENPIGFSRGSVTFRETYRPRRLKVLTRLQPCLALKKMGTDYQGQGNHPPTGRIFDH